jgi:hypothetical protein
MASVVGKTIFSDGKGKLYFGYYKDDDGVTMVDYKTWKNLGFKDVSKGDTNKERVIKAILKNQKQFNKKVEFNMWAKQKKRTFEETMDWFIKNGWINNINKGGIKESIDVLSVNEAKFKIKHTITKKEWDKTHKDYKSVIDGVHYVMKMTDKGSALVPVNITESVTEGKKRFKVNPQIGKSKYSISSHDGIKKHKDGSDFFDIETFKNKVDLEKAIKNYTSKGFKMESVNEAKNDDKYVVIDFHEKGGGFVMTKPGSKKAAEDSARSIRKGSDISKREVLKVSDARKIRGLAGKNYLNEESINESVNEDTKKRFDVDFYKGNGDRQTSHEEIIIGDKFSDVVSQATKVAKSKGMNYVEFYYKDAFIGSIDKKSNYTFKKGRNYQKSPLSVNEAKFGYKDSTASYINNHKDEYKVAEKMNKGNEMKFYDDLQAMEDKIGHPKTMLFISNALRGYGVDMYKDPKIKNPADAQEALFLLSK